MKSSTSTTGQRIRLLRSQRNISQKELAKRMKLSDKTICAYENEQITPATDKLIQLADILGTTTDYLLCRTFNSKDRILVLPDSMSSEQINALKEFISTLFD